MDTETGRQDGDIWWAGGIWQVTVRKRPRQVRGSGQLSCTPYNPVEDWSLTNTSYVPTPISVEDPKDISMLSGLRSRKAPVSDRLRSCVLKDCAAQQGDVVEQVKTCKGIVHRKM
ncbi:unnamed protein product [Pleuronectes platessa]|uniref:Uncharacterized protein n=1 Tax=Pleuronectes platessa TaxID=8262 RepID=A0A9N7TP74_PLEPL|nr:unnamed protein product [Pleuronectes platessa]